MARPVYKYVKKPFKSVDPNHASEVKIGVATDKKPDCVLIRIEGHDSQRIALTTEEAIQLVNLLEEVIKKTCDSCGGCGCYRCGH